MYALIIQFIIFYLKGKSDMQTKLDHAMKDVTDKYLMLEEAEKSAVRTALIEERSRFCLFISCLRPFVVSSQVLPNTIKFSGVKLKRPNT